MYAHLSIKGTVRHDIMSNNDYYRFDPSNIQYKTMKSMDKAARLAMMPDYEMYSVDLTEGMDGPLCLARHCKAQIW